MIEPYDASLYHIPDKVVPDIIMLGSIVEHGILKQPNPTPVITDYHGVVSSTCTNNSLKRFRNQTASQQAILSAMYSATAVLKATDFCFLLIHDIEADPSVKQHPYVLLRSTTLLAQSASVYPWSVMLSTVYLSPWFIVPQRYLNRFLAPTQ